jgi:hypothetical protein
VEIPRTPFLKGERKLRRNEGGFVQNKSSASPRERIGSSFKKELTDYRLEVAYRRKEDI